LLSALSFQLLSDNIDAQIYKTSLTLRKFRFSYRQLKADR
jgi:hypothetical protein